MTVGEPVWELATRFPSQGRWSEQEYLAFEAEHPRIEFVDGSLDVLPMGTNRHQAALEAILLFLKAYGRPTRGVARVAGGRLRLRPGVIREPDVMYLRGERREHITEAWWTHADLVVEVVSPGALNEVRDRVTKRREYAEARIPEYWIVDTESETLTVLALGAEGYEERAVLGRGETLVSARLEGFSASVDEVFDAE